MRLLSIKELCEIASAFGAFHYTKPGVCVISFNNGFVSGAVQPSIYNGLGGFIAIGNVFAYYFGVVVIFYSFGTIAKIIVVYLLLFNHILGVVHGKGGGILGIHFECGKAQ